MDRFTLEQHIMNCWSVVDDIKTLHVQFMDKGNMTEDQISNYLLGLETIYQAKFEQLWDVFEELIKDRTIR